VVPADAKLTPWPADLIPTWDKLSDVEKKLFIRQADVYAAYLAYTDYEIGRVIQKVEDMGKLDNTLIIYISGDNGASAEGSLNGTPFEVVPFNAVTMSAEQQMPFYDVWGTDKTYPHYAIGWGLGLRHTVQVEQANPDLLRRHEERHGDLVARADQGEGWYALAVPPRH